MSLIESETVLRGQRAVLAQIAAGAPLREVLSNIARYSELCTPEMQASILFFEPETGRLRRGGHHHLPDAFADAVDGLEPGPAAGSCGTAAFRRERVVSFDVQVDPLWTAFREFAASHNIRSAWSTPLLSPSDGSLLGVFGMYYPDTREPSEQDLEMVDHFTHLAAISIERQRRDAALRESERQRHRGLLATVAGLAHELNTPLGIALTAESLLTEEIDEAAGAGLADTRRLRAPTGMIRANLERASELVRSWRSMILEESFDDVREIAVTDHVERVLESLRPATDARSLTVTVRRSEGVPVTLRASPVRLSQVVTNLVINAATHAYGPEGGALTISVGPSKSHPGRVDIIVQDEGRGMNEEQRQRCTEPFFTTNRAQGSAGLGLFLVKHIVEAEQHGALLLDTEVGKGVRWTLALPRAASEALERPA